MWGYAEGNQTALTVVVVLIVAAAVAYIVLRLFSGKGR